MKPNAEKFIRVRKGILKEVANSKRAGNILGVYSPALGDGMCLTAVEDVYSSGSDDIVVLKWYDKNAHILSRTHVFIDEISAVCPFNKASVESNVRQAFS